MRMIGPGQTIAMNSGSPAISGSFVASLTASQRRRGPVALRHQLSLTLPFSIKWVGSTQIGLNPGMYLISALGSVASLQTLFSR